MATKKDVMRALRPKTKDLIKPINDLYLEKYMTITMAHIDEIYALLWRGFSLKCQRLEDLADMVEKQCLYNVGYDLEEIFDEYFKTCEDIENCDFNMIAMQLYREDDICNHSAQVSALSQAHVDALNKLQDSYPYVEYRFLIGACDRFTLTCNSQQTKYWQMSWDEFVGAVNEPFLKAQHKMHKMARRFGLFDDVNELLEEEEVVMDTGEVIIKKILDRKELQKRVRECGYSFKSQTGSHRKYEDEDGNVVIVPIHAEDIGKGLSYKIQKEMQNKAFNNR